MKKEIIIGFIFSIVFAANAQIDYTTTSSLTPANEIRLDLKTSYFQTALYAASGYKKLKHLTFSNSGKTPLSEIPSVSFNAKYIYILEFDNISKADFDQILFFIRRTDAINTLIIKNTKIENIPMLFIKTKGVKTLIIDNCKTLNPISVISVFNTESFLKTLRITNCEIYSLDNVFPANNFSVIDLRNNHLSYAGVKLAEIKSLDSVFLSGNRIPNAAEDLMCFRNKRLRYVETDSISVSAHTKLRAARKNIQWKFISSSSAEKETKKVFGQFVVNTSKYKVYSSAYMQYEKLFTNAQFFINLDTATLDEKFWDTLNMYSRQTPIVLNNNIFRLFKEKNIVRKHIAFGFNKDKKGINLNYYSWSKSNFYKAHPEMTIYKKYHWITEKPMTSKKFRIFSKTTFRDLRLIYDGVGKSYTLYLKKIDGHIITLKVFPAKGKSKKNIKNNSGKYASDYARYISSLSKRNRKHDRDILRNKRRVYSSIERAKRNAWNNLRSYMSPIEREMSKEEWMQYYYQLIKYEETALLAAYPDEVFTERKLRKMGFSYVNMNVDTSGLVPLSIFFTDENNANIPVDKILVLDKSRMTYKVIYVTSYFNPITITVYKEDDLAFLVYLPDKSVGMVTMDEIEPSILNSADNRIKSQIIDSKLISIGQVLKKFNLQ